MLRLVALLSLRWPWRVVLFGVALLAAGLPFGVTVHRELLAGGFQAPGHDSTRGDELLQNRFPNGPANLILQVTAGARGPDDGTVAPAGRAITARLAAETGVDSVASYWTAQDPGLRSRDGRSALIVARVRGNENDVRKRMSSLYPRYAGRQDGLTVRFGGQPAVQRELADELQRDLVRAELLSAPLLLIALLFVFRGVVAALLPLVLGGFSVLSTLIVLGLLARATEVSVFALNMASALGLGLAIDYSLFILTRYREETAAGHEVRAAVLRSVRTAGHTVLFSGLTLATCLAATLIFPLYYLRSFAYAGITVVLLSVLGALVLLPALLRLLGPRVELGRLPGRSAGRARLRQTPAPAAPARRGIAGPARAVPLRTAGDRFWFGAARVVLRHRVPAALAGIAVLLLLALPFGRARFALPDDRMLPVDSEAHQVTQALRGQFPDCVPCAIPVVAEGGPAAGTDAQLAGYAAGLSAIAGVDRVDSAAGSYRRGQLLAPATASAARFRGPDGAQWMLVQPETKEPYSAAALALVDHVRAAPAPVTVHVSGLSGHARDTQRTLRDRIPLAVGWIVAAMFVLLVLFARSLLIPLKAIVLSALSLTATFGAMVFVFQEGHLRWLVGDFQVSGLLEETTLVLMFFVAFGMSMDYELFLLSRIKESYDRYGDNTRAVMIGLGQTGRLVTSAAVCMVLVLLAFATSPVSGLKMLGFGLALAIIADATVVRGVLVPALMGLLGRANWWLPGRTTG